MTRPILAAIALAFLLLAGIVVAAGFYHRSQRRPYYPDRIVIPIPVPDCPDGKCPIVPRRP